MYVKVTNGTVDQYPYTVGKLRRDNPNTSFPKNVSEATLSSYGVYPVETEIEPTYNSRTQKLVQANEPTLVDDTWTIQVTVEDKSAEEIQADEEYHATKNRYDRDELLSDCDWTQMPDSPLSDSDKAAWATYRQALRDITSNANWPYITTEDLPVKP